MKLVSSLSHVRPMWRLEAKLPLSDLGFLRRLGQAAVLACAGLLGTAPAQAADPVRGAQLYANSPGGGMGSCASCHGGSPLTSNGSRIYVGRNSTARIQTAVSNNTGGMRYFNNYYNAADFADIAAYLGNSPTTLSFASTAVGSTSAVQSVTVRASTSGGLTGISVSATGDFSRSGGTCGASLNTGLSCTVGVVFTPTASGSRSGALAISHSGVATPVQITLAGTATGAATAPVASLSATSLAFAATTVGTAATAQQLTLSNTGNAALALTSVGTGSSEFTVAGGTCVAGASVAAGGSCTVSVGFTPSASGSRSATLSLVHNAAGSPSTVALSGSGTAAAAPVASLSAASLGFGSVTLGQPSATQTITLRNTGTATLTLGTLAAPSAEFALGSSGSCASNANLAAGSSCTLALVFTPASVGSRSATLSIPHNAGGSPSVVALSGTGLAGTPVASASPTALSFSQVLGSSSAAQTVTLSNTGSAAMVLSALNLAGNQPGDFAVVAGGTCSVGTSVAAGSGCTVLLRFTPTLVGARSATLSLVHNASGSPTVISLDGTATAQPQGALSLNASSLNFGSAVLANPASAQTVTVTNSGSAPVVFSALSLSGSAAADFSRTGSCSTASPLAVGSSCSMVLGFTPSAIGSRSATLTLASNASNATAAVSLQGTGTAAPAPAVSLSVAALDFGSQTVGSSTALRSITLSNSGSGTLALSGISTAAPFALSHNCGVSLAAAASCTVQLSFTPTSTGAASGSLVVGSNAAGSPNTTALQGNGVASLPVLGWLPAATNVGWGNVAVGSTGPSTTLTLHNAGPGSATLGAATITGAQAAEFSLAAGNGCTAGTVLAAGSNCSLVLGFAPQAAGARSATLAIVSDAASPGSLALSGTGVAVAAPAITVSPTGLNFGTNGSAGAQSLSISNAGAAVLRVSAVQVASGPFSLSSVGTTACPAAPFDLLPGQSCTLSVQWGSASNASDGGVLSISSNASSTDTQLPLSAQRVATGGGSSDDDNDKDSGHGSDDDSSKSGGGCTVAPAGATDPLFPGLLLAAGLGLWWRRRAR